MAVNAYPYRWGLEEFLLAWEAGSFTKRTELLDGEVWDVPIGNWHGRTTGRAARAMPNGSFEVSTGSLPTGPHLPEPDLWMLRSGARPVEQLSPRMSRWAATDVPLVVEVSDETHDYDLTHKSRLYAEAGFPVYWSITREGVYVHTGPGAGGYRHRLLVGPDEQVAMPYAPDVMLAVRDLLAPED